MFEDMHSTWAQYKRPEYVAYCAEIQARYEQWNEGLITLAEMLRFMFQTYEQGYREGLEPPHYPMPAKPSNELHDLEWYWLMHEYGQLVLALRELRKTSVN